MERNDNLFFATVRALHKAGALEGIILIGSWCHYFYRQYFDNAPEIPAVRTLDIDFLIPNPPKIKKEVNIPEILTALDFNPIHNYTTGYIKYGHPELELEFLTPDLGKGKGNEPYRIPKLHIKAQGLRFLNLLQAYTMKITYEDITIRLPEPAAYVLHKFIIYKRRTKKNKRDKDLQAAREIGEFLLQKDEQRKRLSKIFNDLPEKWQAKIKENLKEDFPVLYEFLHK
jgi:hypothetical protein